jgi:hypothetical protein
MACEQEGTETNCYKGQNIKDGLLQIDRLKIKLIAR